MKTPVSLPIALAALCAASFVAADAAERPAPAVALEPVDADPCWRFSVGFRAAPGIKTSAAVDARAAAVRAAMPAPGRTKTTSVRGGGVVTTTEGTTEADAKAELGPGYTGADRYEFEGGYIDMDDGAGLEGETQNWHFDHASAFEDGVIVLDSRDFGSRTTSRSRTTRTTTETTVATSFAEDLRDDSTETAPGLDLRLDRTVWENADFGVDVGLGYAWYGDVDCFSVAGRACTSTRTVVRTTETTDYTGASSESGTVSTTLAEPEFTDLDDILNADGSIGGGYVVGGKITDGYKIPVLTVTPDRFGTVTKQNPSLAAAYLSKNRSSSRETTRRTLDVRSEGTLSLQELRLGAHPFWKATQWLAVRADVGLLAIHSELETETRLFVDGAPAASIRRDDDDWNIGGFAGLSIAAAATDRLELSVGAEARFPHRSIRFDDGVVSGKVDLAEWSAFAALGLRF